MSICPICKEDNATWSHGAAGDKHLFHEPCITEWKKRNPTCPICRVNILSRRERFLIFIRNPEIIENIVSFILRYYSCLFSISASMQGTMISACIYNMDEENDSVIFSVAVVMGVLSAVIAFKSAREQNKDMCGFLMGYLGSFSVIFLYNLCKSLNQPHNVIEGR